MVSGKVSGNGDGRGGKSVMGLARRVGMLEAYRGGFKSLREVAHPERLCCNSFSK